MGNKTSVNCEILDNPEREFFVVFNSYKCVKSRLVGTYIVYTFTLKYQRYSWEVHIRYNELVSLDRRLVREYPSETSSVIRPSKHSKMFWTHDDSFLLGRAKIMTKYLQDILDGRMVFEKSKKLRSMVNVSNLSFNPDFGRKGKEGYLIKCSGGYVERFSRKTGDYFNVWTWRYFVLTDNCISWYASPEDSVPKGTLQIDQSFHFVTVDRVISIYTATRKLVVQAWTKRSADEWVAELRKFYVNVPKTTIQHFQSTFPPRLNTEVKVYTYSRDYMSAAAIAMLGAQKEILITSWKNSPGVLLTRPPLPPLRLDQILKFKAEQGVQIFILLYKEVEYVGQGNDSQRTKSHLESLSPNIHVIRHPNKFMGGSTAVMWSHHEKLVIVDRNLAFVGGIDLAYQRWDDEEHRVSDEDGLYFPGHDYRQPAPGLFKAVRTEMGDGPNNTLDGEEEEEIEVEIAVPGESESLPYAVTTSGNAEDSVPYEVEVVVDFSVQSAEIPFVGSSAPTNLAQDKGESTRGPSAIGAKEVPVDLEEDRMSDVSENWAEDRFAEETEDEKQAKREAEGGGDQRSSHRSTMSSVYEGIKQSRSTMSQTVDYFSSQFRAYKEQVSSFQRVKKKVSSLESRDQFPRMPWHDVQAALSGSATRDIASHFVQRWNHHRLSTSNYSEPIMYDINCNTTCGICARCDRQNIPETMSQCPTCGLQLGPVNSFSRPSDPAMCPAAVETFSYLVFQCTFHSALPFRIQGDCPVVVTALLQSSRLEDHSAEGTLLDLNGPMAEWLHAFGLIPAVGDVVLALDGHLVTHLNSNQFKRLVKRRRLANKLKGDSAFIAVTFRRHYLENLHPVDKKFETARQALSYVNNLLDEPLDEGKAEGESEINSSDTFGGNRIVPHNEGRVVVDESTHTMGDDEAKVADTDQNIEVTQSAMAISEYAASAVSIMDSEAAIEKGGDAPHTNDRVAVVEVYPVQQNSIALLQQSSQSSQPGDENSKKVALYHPACQAAAHQELKLAMGQIFHAHSKHCDLLPRIPDGSGTCKVQVLRSIGKWSVGTRTECSILNCWVETIQSAQRFIYIENQFFIGNNAGDGVSNGIPAAIVERILAAHALKEVFRVVVVIPVHPNGDYAGAMKSRVVMHYQYQTINRGLTSMFAVLRKKAPGINISDYIGFFSLRNWGVMNNKVVSDQVYVHDKLLIVDDRVAIIGSANINDRSMVGSRDSEVAVRIEDTLHLDITMNGHSHTVGYLPHTLRLRLMKQHICDETLDLSDPVKSEVFNRWKYIANKNSSIYDELDGNLSVYRCTTMSEYNSAFGQFTNKSYLDPMVRDSLSQIQGFLVDWPQNLFKNEDLSPSMATRALISNELWY